MTGNEIITESRRDISDEITPYRYEDPEFVDAINAARREIYRTHPESVCVNGIVTGQPTEVTALTLGADLGMDNRFRGPLVHFVDYRLLNRDSEDPMNLQAANDHYAKFLQEMG